VNKVSRAFSHHAGKGILRQKMQENYISMPKEKNEENPSIDKTNGGI
jgi:hypothetical protein